MKACWGVGGWIRSPGRQDTVKGAKGPRGGGSTLQEGQRGKRPGNMLLRENVDKRDVVEAQGVQLQGGHGLNSVNCYRINK